MKKQLRKPNKKRISHKACSSESSGCDIHVYLFGTPCIGCTHLEAQKPKDCTYISKSIKPKP